MTPEELSKSLFKIATYIENSERPELSLVMNKLNHLVKSVNPRTSADLSRILDGDLKATAISIDNLTKRLDKVVSTMNPQDASRELIEKVIMGLVDTKIELDAKLKPLKNVQV